MGVLSRAREQFFVCSGGLHAAPDLWDAPPNWVFIVLEIEGIEGIGLFG